MKHTIKLFGIIAIVAMIGFSMTACSDGSSDAFGGEIQLPPAGDGSISFAEPWTEIDVFLWDDFPNIIAYTGGPINFTKVEFIIDFTSDFDQDKKKISYITDNPSEWNISIDSFNKLSLKLGTPKEGALKNASAIFSPSNFVSTSGLKVFMHVSFYSGNNFLDWENHTAAEMVSLVYANMDGTISGSYYDSTYDYTMLVNMTLKAGWNTAIFKEVSEEVYHLVTGMPNSNFKWFYKG